jgi:hypothetical protein
MYRKNVANQYIYFALVSTSTGTGLTGASVTAYLALDNGAQATATGTTSELGNGQYRFNLSQADTNADEGSYLFIATGASPVEKTVVFTAANPSDGAAFGLSKLADIETDTQDIQSRLPAALNGGRMVSNAEVVSDSTIAKEATLTNRPTLLQIEGSTVLAKELTVASRATQASVNLIPTNPLRDNDARLNFIDASIATSASSILSAISNLNNLSAKCNLFGSSVLEAPETGSTSYEFTLVVNDDEGKLVNLDALPTITATNSSGVDRSTNLSAVTNPSVGRYRFTYTVAASHAREPLRIDASGTVSSEARYAPWSGAVVDFDNLSVLNQILSELALKPTLLQIEASSILAKVTTPLIVGQVNAGAITAASIDATAITVLQNGLALQSTSLLIDKCTKLIPALL